MCSNDGQWTLNAPGNASVSGREGDGWEDVGEWKGNANKLSCHTGTINVFLLHLLCMNLFINLLIQAVMFM